MASSLLGGVIAAPQTNGYRLSLTTALAVTTADVTGATTIYCTPYTGDQLALYDGTATWQLFNPGEFSLPLGTLADGTKPWDVFCFNSAGAPTLEFLVWASTSARATALVLQNGVWVKTGATTRRYMGTFMPTSTTQTEDSVNNRYLFNANNRVLRTMSTTGPNATYAYTTATWRPINLNVTVGQGRFNIMVGQADGMLECVAHASCNNTGGNYVACGIGINSTSANSAQVFGDDAGAAFSNYESNYAWYKGYPAVGQQFIQHIENSAAAGTTTWNNTTQTQLATAMVASMRM